MSEDDNMAYGQVDLGAEGSATEIHTEIQLDQPTQRQQSRAVDYFENDDVGGADLGDEQVFGRTFVYSIYKILKQTNDRYAPHALYITENGAAFADTLTADGRVHDDAQQQN